MLETEWKLQFDPCSVKEFAAMKTLQREKLTTPLGTSNQEREQFIEFSYSQSGQTYKQQNHQQTDDLQMNKEPWDNCHEITKIEGNTNTSPFLVTQVF